MVGQTSDKVFAIDSVLALTMINKNIKILTLNIQKGWSLGKVKYTVEQIREKIAESGANIVCLQEVMGSYPELTEKSQL